MSDLVAWNTHTHTLHTLKQCVYMFHSCWALEVISV